jgi:hypothetical protein
LSLKTSSQVAEIAISLRTVTESNFRQKYFMIDAAEYSRKPSEEDLEYTWHYFAGLEDFYARAALANRHVIFTVDQ